MIRSSRRLQVLSLWQRWARRNWGMSSVFRLYAQDTRGIHFTWTGLMNAFMMSGVDQTADQTVAVFVHHGRCHCCRWRNLVAFGYDGRWTHHSQPLGQPGSIPYVSCVIRTQVLCLWNCPNSLRQMHGIQITHRYQNVSCDESWL